METVSAANRIAFLDNIRSLIIIFVLIFHSGASYGAGVDFWPFHENSPSGIIDFFMFIGDVFFMAIMFFIAGYFVLPDLLKKGLCRFLKDKLKRLGLPWLVITTTAVVPFTFPLLLSNISIPVFIKFIIVSIVTLIFSYAIGILITKIMSRNIKNDIKATQWR